VTCAGVGSCDVPTTPKPPPVSTPPVMRSIRRLIRLCLRAQTELVLHVTTFKIRMMPTSPYLCPFLNIQALCADVNRPTLRLDLLGKDAGLGRDSLLPAGKQ